MVVHTKLTLATAIEQASYGETLSVVSEGVKRAAGRYAVRQCREDLIFVVADADESEDPISARRRKP